jgi:hypothetical protein
MRKLNYLINLFLIKSNLGIPTLGYGLAGLLLVKHSEYVNTSKGQVKIYFWYKENRQSPY